ncbi:hypothetical protein PanWU01x14_308390, partial [Parasponia andersonii]
MGLLAFFGPSGVFLRLDSASLYVLLQFAGMNRHHDLYVEVATVDGVMSVIFMKLAVPTPIFHMLRNARFGQVFENAPVLVLEVDHIDRRVKLVLRQWVTGHLPPLAAFLTALGGGFLFRNRPSVLRRLM